jgi:hypothetical protein
VRRNHLLAEQIDQQHGCVAFRAVTAQTDGTIKEMAIWAAALADEAFAAVRALVDGLRHDSAAALQFLAEASQIGWAGLMSRAESMLLMSSRAIACAT